MLKLQRLRSTRISNGTAKVIFGGVLSGICRSLSKLASFPSSPSHAQQLRRVASLLSPNFLLFPYSIPVRLCGIFLDGFIFYYLFALLLINQLVVYFVEWLNVGDLVGFGVGWGRPSFGIAFDIDGVLVRGNTPIGGSPNALMRLYDDYGSLKVPYVFLTNGGGIPESRRAIEMSKLFGLNITQSQILQGHSPFKQLVKRFQNKFVVAVGKGEPAAVMTAYGFRNVLAIDDYASCFDDIDPLSPYKRWSLNKISDFENCKFEVQNLRDYVNSQRVEAVFVVSDSVDWSRDIQVLCDILRTGGLPGTDVKCGQQLPLYFAHDDLAYQARFPTERFGMGAFRIALESVFNSIHSYPLLYTAVGKPNSSAFKNAEAVLMQLYHQCVGKPIDVRGKGVNPLKTIYMIGDNPSVDIKGALQAGKPWFSILTRTGVFKGKENDGKFPADMVVDTVEDAVEYIFTREGWSVDDTNH